MMYSRRCKWANEGCRNNNECCSGTCDLLHPGTNQRCTESSMGQPCLFGFHCDVGLKCGQDHICCAGHWGTCSADDDCCAEYHKCRKMKGFVYKKCLPRPRTLFLPKGGSQPRDQLICNRINVATFCIIAVLLRKLAIG